MERFCPYCTVQEDVVENVEDLWMQKPVELQKMYETRCCRVLKVKNR